MTQRITDDEIDYITKSVVPLFEKLLQQTNSDDSGKIREGIDMIKSILSKETFNIMQIIRFNFKEAIGEP